MRKLIALSIFTPWFAFIFACAGLAPILEPADFLTEENGKTLTVIQRPAVWAADGGKAKAIALPKPVLSRREALLRLRDRALRFQSGFRDWLRAVSLARADRPKSEAVSASNSRPPAGKREVRPPVAKTRRPSEYPPVGPVAANDTGDQPATGGKGGVRTIFARLGDDVEISFKENGWLLLERPPEGSGLQWVNRWIEEGKTLFKFRSQKIGSYLLPFQYQDQAKGTVSRQTIEIKVVSQKEFDAALGGRESEAEKEDRAKRRAAAVRLLELGDFKDALRDLLASYSEGDPDLNQLIAALALREKDYRNAILFWNKNLNAPGALRDKAVLGLVRANLAVDDRNALVALARSLLTVQSQTVEEELGLLIRYFSANRDDPLELDLLQAYLKRYPSGKRLAEIYFLLGQIHEFSRAFLDFKKSRECYQVVVREFPESLYYAPARERIDFLNRHYFRVQ